MPENDRKIPKPTIRTTPPARPPVTTVDTAASERANAAPEIQKESEKARPPSPRGVETDLVKRFLGVIIDGVVAGVIGAIIALITGSPILQYLAIGLVFLTRDSLPILEGQSIGKKIMQTKAVKEDGSSLSGDWITGATRNILFVFPVVGFPIEAFFILTRSGRAGDGRRLGDDWAKTKVITVD
ncbi:RDD family protein [Akkermansiaceae bacterium]|nr:RDD family protein [Akkermansiaceae bacterium]MDB4289321.1 RDD family protein [bacterium]MDB4142725.1 RDD family protein [Akkermansiaceae bacterium]MDB4258432.1 RDD family protein [Akkermansiaceae bacterium]MDB4262260.1 RDD family protein [Akkermansiaceae bacterium]